MKKKYCPTCHFVGKPTYRGSLFVTLILLCLGILPGLIYEGWRTSGGARLCPRCKNNGMYQREIDQ